MSKAPGSKLPCKWLPPGMPGSSISEDEKAKILFQLGVITEQLSRLRFPQAGSLFKQDGKFHIKTCLSRGLLEGPRDILDDILRGPFTTERDYYEALITALLEHAECLPLATHCFFAPIPAEDEYESYTDRVKATDHWNFFVAAQDKVDSSHNRTDLIIAGEALRNMITQWTTELPQCFPTHEQNRFALHHADLSVGNVFFDEDLTITCIIDWQFCSAVPLSMLLTAPGQPQTRYKIHDSLVSVFEDGFLHALKHNPSPQPTGMEEHLRRILNTSRPISLFTRFVTLDCLNDYHVFESLVFESLWQLTQPPEKDLQDYFRSAQQSDKYIARRAEAAEDDPTAEALAKYEKDHGLEAGKVHTTIARRLTLVSEWNSRYRKEDGKRRIRRNAGVFVADWRLWKWIADCLRDLEES
ncbi:MAG: hypothetical protein Q9209_003209 [Squamulea sp. 1 TL-2023]